jgi:DNA-binding transcriptional regulator YiaG
MKTRFQKQEENRLRSLKREYEQKDYRVLINPSKTELPRFLSGLEPDMIAYGPKESVVIEVKTQSNLSKSPHLKAIAEAVQSQDGWRFELVVINSEKQRVVDEEALNLDHREIQNRLKASRALLDQKQYAAAFLLAWSATEAILRERARASAGMVESHFPSKRLFKEFYAIGSFSRSDYETLSRLLEMRNLIVHGFRAVDLSPKEVEKLFRFIAQQQEELGNRKIRLEVASPEEAKAFRFSPGLMQSLRKHLDITQKELAILAKVTVGAVQQWESGKFKPKEEEKRVIMALRKLRRRDVRRMLDERGTR